MLLSTQCIIAQTEFTSLGADDSGGTGFKTTNISELVVSNDYTHENGDIYGSINGAFNTEVLTLKADGTNAESFTLDNLNVYHFGGSTTYSGATIVFKDKTGTTLQTMSNPGSLGSSPVSIETLFTVGNTLPIQNVAEIIITITGGSSPSNFTLDNITISNPVAPVPCTEPDVPTVMADAICAGGNTATLAITGNLNDATEWVVYSDAAGTSSVTTVTSTATEVTIANVSATTTYYVRGEGACATPGTLTAVEVTVNPLETASAFFYTETPYCVDATDPTPFTAPGNNTSGGTYTSTAGLNLNASTGAIDLSASTPGTYSVTYTTPGTCSAMVSSSVTILALDDATFSYDAAAYAFNAMDPTPTITGLTGGSFTASPAGLSISPTAGIIDVSASTPGDYMVTYITNGTCANSSTVNVSVYAAPTITSITDDTGSSTTDFITSDNTPTVSGTATPGSTIAITVNGTSSANIPAMLGGPFTVTADISGNFNFPFPVTPIAPSLPDAQAIFSVTSTINGVSLTSDNQAATIDTAAPTFTSATTASVFSGATGTVYTATATDATTIAYSISGGNDMAAISITAAGEVTFNTTPDFDNPTDTGMDNTYVVDILATDAAGNTNTQTLTITVLSNTFTWLGTTNNDWSTASNWDLNSVPTTTANVIIPAPSNVAVYPVSTTDITVNSIAIADGATFIPGGLVTGTLTYTKNINTTNWELVSSAVNGESVTDVIADIGMNIAMSGSGNQGFSIYNNANASGNAWEFAPAASVSGTLNNGQGYAVKLNSTGTVNFSGTANTSDVVVAVADGTIDNFTLLGNPFLANINAGDFLSDNGPLVEGPLAEQSLWFWDGTAYQTANEMTAEAIAPGTGFFIETDGSGDITFSYEDQTNSQGQVGPLRKTSNTTTNKFELFIATAEKKTSTKLFYVADKTTGFDNGFDSKMFGGTTYDLAVYTELVTDNQGNKLAIQTLPDTLDAVVPVGIIAKAGDTIVFSVENLNLPEGIDVYLEDKVTGTFTNLSETTYETTFSADTNTSGQFYVHTTAAKTLSNEDIINNNISIYTSNDSELTIAGLHTNADVVIYSLLGKQVLNITVAGNGANTINLPAVNAGVYIVKLNTDTGILTKKITLN